MDAVEKAMTHVASAGGLSANRHPNLIVDALLHSNNKLAGPKEMDQKKSEESNKIIVKGLLSTFFNVGIGENPREKYRALSGLVAGYTLDTINKLCLDMFPSQADMLRFVLFCYKRGKQEKSTSISDKTI